MNARFLTNYYVWGIKALVFIIPFLSLWIARSMYFPYISGRNFGFRILVEIALALWVALIVLRKEYRPKMTPIAIAVLAFLAIVGIADLLGVDSYASFWSRLERMEGWIMIAHLAAYFFILTSVFRTKKDWLVFLNLFLITGILVGGYGILQVLGIKEAIQGGDVRIDGTIGNPTYLAAYLTLVIALAFVLLFNAKTRGWKLAYGAAIAYSLFVMFFTASRGAALAWLVAVPLSLILYLIFFRGVDGAEKKFKKIAIVGLILMVIVPALFLGLKKTSFVQDSPTLSRVVSVSLGEKTIRSRFYIWGMAWNAFLERPILGWGQENFIIAFSKYYDPRLYDQEPWFDRPHNIFFEWLINAGIFGIIAYLALLGSFFWTVNRLLKKNLIGRKEWIILWVAPIAYFLQNFFVFDNFNTYVIFFGLLAYANGLYQYGVVSVAQKPDEKLSDKKSSRSLGVLGVSVVIAVAVIYFVNVRAWAQAQGIINGLQATASNVNPVQGSLDAFKKTLTFNSFGNGEAIEQLARVASLLVSQEQVPANQKIPFLQYTIQQLESYIKKFPLNVRIKLMTSSLYQGMRGFNPEFVLLARAHMKAALELSPKKQQIIFILAENYLTTSETDKAVELLERAVALEPSNREAQVNLALIGILVGRGDIVTRVMNDLEKIAKNHKDLSLEDGLISYASDLSRIARFYLNNGQISNARGIYNRMLLIGKEYVLVSNHQVYKQMLKDLDEDL